MQRFRLILLAVISTISAQTLAHEAGDLLIRLGVANVAPDASSSALILDGNAVGSSEADVDNNIQLGSTIAYMLTDNWAVEVLASTPFTHDISADTGALGLGNIDAGETSHLPPTVSLLYFPAQADKKFQPYVGVGVNYTIFFEEDVDSELEAVLGRGSLELDNSFGLALQAGFDYRLTEKLYLNASVWWADIDTEAEFQFANNRITTDVDIDPFVYKLSLAWKI